MQLCNFLTLWFDSQFKLNVLSQNESGKRGILIMKNLELQRKYCLFNSNHNDKDRVFCKVIDYGDDIALLNIAYNLSLFWLASYLSYDYIPCYFIQINFYCIHLRIFVYELVYFILVSFNSSLNWSVLSQILNSVLAYILYGYDSIFQLLFFSNMDIFYHYQDS